MVITPRVNAAVFMGHEGNVTRAIRKVNGNPARRSKLADLETMLVSRDPIDDRFRPLHIGQFEIVATHHTIDAPCWAGCFALEVKRGSE